MAKINLTRAEAFQLFQQQEADSIEELKKETERQKANLYRAKAEKLQKQQQPKTGNPERLSAVFSTVLLGGAMAFSLLLDFIIILKIWAF